MTGASVVREKNKDAISKVLSVKLAIQIGRFFHKHDLDAWEEGRNKTPD